MDLIKSATRRSGGAYIYSNLEGGDGERLYFDGGSMVGLNGSIIDIEDRFTLRDVQVLITDIPISTILSYRLKNNSFENQGSKQKQFTVINININLISQNSIPYTLKGGAKSKKANSKTNSKAKADSDTNSESESDSESESKSDTNSGTLYKNNNSKFQAIPEIENITNAASSWLWDYLRRSGAMAFMLPLSGGADSGATATIVYNMCVLMFNTFKNEKKSEFYAVKNVTAYINKFFELRSGGVENIKGPEQLCSRILNTVYLPTKISGKNNASNKDIPNDKPSITEIKERASSMKTGFLAAQLAKVIGARHDVVEIQNMFEAGINDISSITKVSYEDMRKKVIQGRRINASNKSTWDLLYQNIQARLRMINTYLLAQAIPSIHSDKYKTSSFILVLGSSNSDEVLVGYYTKYDASAADINPIGSLSKYFVNEILDYYGTKGIYPLLYIRNATPTAELIDNSLELGDYVKFKDGRIGIINKINESDNDNNLTFNIGIEEDNSSKKKSKHKPEEIKNVKRKEIEPQFPIIKQSDELDMGITYNQIYELGKLRANGYGPIDSYIQIMNNPKLKEIFSIDPADNQIQPNEVLKRFYNRYTVNRNKATIIPPSVHLTPSPDTKTIVQGTPKNEQLEIINEITKKYKEKK
jgi:NAD+ synthase (glutamine-hydrolysing)